MLGNKIRELRTIRNINQQELANAIGVSKSSVAMWEVDKREPTLSKVNELANYFGVPSDFLLGLGVFQDWEKITKNKDRIIELLEKTFGKSELIKHFDNYLIFIIFLNTAVNRIEFHDDGDFDIYLYPLYEDNSDTKNSTYIKGDNHGIQAVNNGNNSSLTVNGSERQDTDTQELVKLIQDLPLVERAKVVLYINELKKKEGE